MVSVRAQVEQVSQPQLPEDEFARNVERQRAASELQAAADTAGDPQLDWRCGLRLPLLVAGWPGRRAGHAADCGAIRLA